MSELSAIVCAEHDGPPHLVARTRGALAALGLSARVVAEPGALRGALPVDGAAWLLRAGVFDLDLPAALLPSATGRPVIGFGAACPAPPPTREQAPLVDACSALLARCGGDIDPRLPGLDALPFGALWLSPEACARLRATDAPPDVALARALPRAFTGCRVVHVASLDVAFAHAPRVLEVVTSLQIGGAERVARDLAKHLPRAGIDAKLVGLGTPTRARWAPLLHEIDLGAKGLSTERRLDLLVEHARAWGADVVHSHLFGPDLFDALAAARLPHVTTIHNAEQGWPASTRELEASRVELVIGCAAEVERQLRAAGVRAPLRAVQNGIELDDDRSASARGAVSEAHVLAGRAALAAAGVRPGALTVLVVANPRRQKRLDRVAPIAAEVARASGREVAVVWAGGASDRHVEAQEESARFERAMRERGVTLCRLGAEAALLPLYAAADVLLSTSDWEGLSLGHLEAVAAGLPLVATDVGGTREITGDGAFIERLAADAAPSAFAAAILRAVAHGRGGRLHPRFGVAAMARGYARLLRHAARRGAAHAAPLSGLVLVTNNFSPGGAQSSARRLLLELAARGVPVTAVTIEEELALAGDPRATPGTAALRAAGIPVVQVPRALDAAHAADCVADEVVRRGARSVVFWNLIAEHKLLLAELLYDRRVFDVSPGEMYFDSLGRALTRPRDDLVVSTGAAYGARLAGVVVKFEGERDRAREVLGCDAHVIANGVPRGPAPGPRAGATVVFGTAVRIHPHKRLELLLQAFRLTHEVTSSVALRVIGSADAGQEAYAAELRAGALDLPVEWVPFTDDLAPFLSTLDVFVLVAEPAGCPNASLEALAVGLPVIATDCGGIREQLGGGAGIVVPREDERAFADAMLSLARSPADRAELARRGWARAKDTFSLERMVGRYADVLELPVAPKRRGG